MTNRIPTPPDARTVIVGVDTHTHVHVAVAIDSWGIRLRDHAFVVDSGGYQALITWAETHGRIDAFGIEGAGSYGAGLARAVRRAGHRVVEVNRGDRRTRRAAGKSDTLDAEVAARSVLAGQSTAIPKTADGAVEMMRQLKITRDTAVKARTTAMNTLKRSSCTPRRHCEKPSTTSPITACSRAAGRVQPTVRAGQRSWHTWQRGGPTRPNTDTRRARPSLQARRPGGPDALLGDMQSDRLGGGSPSQRR